MAQRKEKTIVLLLCGCVLALSCLPITTMGMHTGCTLAERALYPAFHVNVIHAALNCWCLLSVTFTFNLNWKPLLMAYLIAISYPSALMTDTEIVGMSGVCFALFGLVALSVKRKLYYQSWVIFYLLIAFLFPNVAV